MEVFSKASPNGEKEPTNIWSEEWFQLSNENISQLESSHWSSFWRRTNLSCWSRFLTHSYLDNFVALIKSVTGLCISFSNFNRRANSLAFYLQNVTKLSKKDTVFLPSIKSIEILILYFFLLSLSVIISPGNLVSIESEISHQIQLSNPVIVFATSSTIQKLPKIKK